MEFVRFFAVFNIIIGLAVIPFAHALHESEIEAQSITVEDYLDQLTESVDAEIDGNSMMGHKPPNRWYRTGVAKGNDNHGNGHPVDSQRIEHGLSIILLNHYNYLIKVRHQLEKLNNMVPGKLDLWPLRVSSLGSGEDEDGGLKIVGGWRQQDWMDHIFDEMSALRMEMEDLMEE